MKLLLNLSVFAFKAACIDGPAPAPGRVLAALLRAGWSVKRQTGSHRTLSKDGWPDYVFSFHDRVENWAEIAGPNR